MLSLAKQIPIQSLLYKTTSNSLSPKWKKTCLKQPIKIFTQVGWVLNMVLGYTVKKVAIKKIFPQLCKTFCIFILNMHILFCCKNKKNVLQKEEKTETLKSIYRLRNTALDSGWLNHWKWLAPDPMQGSWLFYQKVWI